MSSVLDTNIAIHKLHGELDKALPVQAALISVISEIELLGFSGTTPAHEADVRALISTITVVPLNEGIKDETIRLKRTLRFRLPDAIVLATAIVTGSELLTNDHDLIAKAVPLVLSRSVAMKPRVEADRGSESRLTSPPLRRGTIAVRRCPPSRRPLAIMRV